MLDLDHPQTKFIFEAAGLLDGLLEAEQRMVLVSPNEREAIFLQCQNNLSKLHRLNNERFEASQNNYEALENLEAALRLFCVQDKEQFGDETNPCKRCGKQLKYFRVAMARHYYCSHCSNITRAVKEKLDWGFGTIFI